MIYKTLSVLGLALALVAGTLPVAEDADARSFRSSGSSRSASSFSKPKSYTSSNKSYNKSRLYGTQYKSPAAKPPVRNTVVHKQTTIVNQGGGMGGGSGIGGALVGGALGGLGGAMLYDAMTDNEGASKEEVQAQVDEALAKQQAEQQAAELQKQIEALQQQQQQLLGAPALVAPLAAPAQ